MATKNIIPRNDDEGQIGSNSKKWASAYISDGTFDTLTVGGVSVTGGGGSGDKIEEGNSSVEVTDTGSNGTITFKTDNSNKWEITSTGDLLPSTTNSFDIGSSTRLVKDLYISNGSIKFSNADNTATPYVLSIDTSNNKLRFSTDNGVNHEEIVRKTSTGGLNVEVTSTPTNASDVVNKGYVDSVANGLRPKESVNFALISGYGTGSTQQKLGELQTLFTWDSTNQIWVQNTAGGLFYSNKETYGFNGTRYIIRENGGGFDFTQFGASNNSEGQIFVSNNTFSYYDGVYLYDDDVDLRKYPYLEGLSDNIDEEVYNTRILVKGSDNTGNATSGIFKITEGKGDTVIDATSDLISGRRYTITTEGSSMNWTNIGASSSSVDTNFTYNGNAVTGSGGQVKERYVLERTSDFAYGSEVAGASIFINEGSLGNSNYVVTTDKFTSPESNTAAAYLSSSNWYEITSLGNTDWSVWGESSPSVGKIFKPNTSATGTGTGTIRQRYDIVSTSQITFTKFNSPAGVRSQGGLAYDTSEGYYISRSSLQNFSDVYGSNKISTNGNSGLLAFYNNNYLPFHLKWGEILENLLGGGHGIGVHSNDSGSPQNINTFSSGNSYYTIVSVGDTNWSDLGVTSTAKVGLPFYLSSTAFNIRTDNLVSGKKYRITSTGSGVNWTSIGSTGVYNSEFVYNGTTVTASGYHGYVSLTAGTGSVKRLDSNSGFNLKMYANIEDLLNVDSTTPSTNQILKWNGSNWAPANSNSGSNTVNVNFDHPTPGSSDSPLSLSYSSSNNEEIYIMAPTANIAVTLPHIADNSIPEGYKVNIKNLSSSYTITISPSGDTPANRIDASQSITHSLSTQYENITFVADNDKTWYRV